MRGLLAQPQLLQQTEAAAPRADQRPEIKKSCRGNVPGNQLFSKLGSTGCWPVVIIFAVEALRPLNARKDVSSERRLCCERVLQTKEEYKQHEILAKVNMHELADESSGLAV